MSIQVERIEIPIESGSQTLSEVNSCSSELFSTVSKSDSVSLGGNSPQPRVNTGFLPVSTSLPLNPFSTFLDFPKMGQCIVRRKNSSTGRVNTGLLPISFPLNPFQPVPFWDIFSPTHSHAICPPVPFKRKLSKGFSGFALVRLSIGHSFCP